MNTKQISSLLLLACYAIPQVHSDKPSIPTPFLALIEVNQTEENSPEFFNGAFLSMLWVMTVSPKLAQEPTGEPRNKSLVHGAVKEFWDLVSFPTKPVIKIVTDVKQSKNNKLFPNLVLLRVESEFKQTDLLQPATINVGDLSNLGLILGFAYEITNPTKPNHISYPWTWPVRTWSNKVCKSVSDVKYEEQFCSTLDPLLHGSNTTLLLDGALLVDQNQYVTGMLQFISNKKENNESMGLLILVRLSPFRSFWQSYEKKTKEKKLVTKFKDNDKKFPWNPKGDAVGSFSPWVLVLDTFLLFFLFLFYRQNGSLAY